MKETELFKQVEKFYKENPELMDILHKFRVDKEKYYLESQVIRRQKKIIFASSSNQTY